MTMICPEKQGWVGVMALNENFFLLAHSRVLLLSILIHDAAATPSFFPFSFFLSS